MEWLLSIFIICIVLVMLLWRRASLKDDIISLERKINADREQRQKIATNIHNEITHLHEDITDLYDLIEKIEEKIK